MNNNKEERWNEAENNSIYVTNKLTSHKYRHRYTDTWPLYNQSEIKNRLMNEKENRTNFYEYSYLSFVKHLGRFHYLLLH